MNSAPFTGSSEDGFSILEMIVAMTILALVLGIASQTIVLASRSISIAREQAETARTIRAMMADYDANQGVGDAGSTRSAAPPGWVLRTQEINVSNAKLTAVVIERSASGKGGGSFLTFIPEPAKAP